MSAPKPITLAEARDRLTLSIAEAAYLLGASPSWVYTEAERGGIPVQRREGRILVLAQPFIRQFEEAS
jgi:hypothetical protein